jgi:hypothetical protein
MPAIFLALWRAVRPVTGTEAPSTGVMVGGRFTVDVIGGKAYSANDPPFCRLFAHTPKLSEKSNNMIFNIVFRSSDQLAICMINPSQIGFIQIVKDQAD